MSQLFLIAAIVLQLIFAVSVVAFLVYACYCAAITGSLPGLPARDNCPECGQTRFMHFYRCPHCGTTAKPEKYKNV